MNCWRIFCTLSITFPIGSMSKDRSQKEVFSADLGASFKKDTLVDREVIVVGDAYVVKDKGEGIDNCLRAL